MQQQIIAYARWSPRPNATECESTATQFDRIEHWAKATGMIIAGRYADEDVSGKSTDGRDQLELALQHACRIKGVVVVYSLSRLARNTADAILISERLQKCGADISSLSERIDTSSAMGRFFFTVMSALAALEREQLSDRTRDAMRRHQASGRRMGRADKCPYGYEPGEPGMLRPVTGEQMMISIMRAARCAGKTYQEIGDMLEQAGYRRRDGGSWASTPSLIRKILNREYPDGETPPPAPDEDADAD